MTDGVSTTTRNPEADSLREWLGVLIEESTDPEQGTELLDAALATERRLTVEVAKEWITNVVSGYPMDGATPLGMGGSGFEQCRAKVLALLDELGEQRP